MVRARQRRHDIAPQIYLAQLLTNLSLTPDGDLSNWLPDRWKLDHKATLASLQDDNIEAS